jgi:glutathione S-transferase
MKLIYSDRSPYARKVRAIAAHHGIELNAVEVVTKPTPPELLAANPLGKVPALVLDSGVTILDSQVIAEYLDNIGTSEQKLLPEDPEARAVQRTLEALADGILEAGVGIVYEQLYRAEGERSKAIMDKYAGQVQRGVEWLAQHLGQFEHGISHAAIAIVCALDYLRNRVPDFGYAQEWTQSQPALVHWLEETLKNPIFTSTAPKSWK